MSKKGVFVLTEEAGGEWSVQGVYSSLDTLGACTFIAGDVREMHLQEFDVDGIFQQTLGVATMGGSNNFTGVELLDRLALNLPSRVPQ